MLLKMNYQVKLIKIVGESSRIKTFRFERPKGFSFIPGQFVMLSSEKVKTPAGIPLRRSYSIASPKNADHLEFCIALGKEDRGLSHYLHQSAKEGEVFTIDGPFGNFTLKLPLKRETIFVAGGTGISPIRSMLHSLSEEDFLQNVWLFFGIRNPEEFLYRKEFEGYLSHDKFRLVAAVSDYQGKDWKGEKGFICDVMAKYIKNGNGKDIYMCGPPIMVDTTLKKAEEIDFSKESIHYEQW
jgi:NAD(P)H-flavin reductase